MKSKSSFKKRLIAVGGSLLSAAICIGGLATYLLSYHQTNADTIATDLSDGSPTIVMFYNPTCEDCKQVEVLTKKLNYTTKLNPKASQIQHVYINVKSSLGKKYVKQFGITETPTYVLVTKNQVLGTYAGTDQNQITNLYTNYEVKN